MRGESAAVLLFALACAPVAEAPIDAAPRDASEPRDAPAMDACRGDPSCFVRDPRAFEYQWTCAGEVAASDEAPSAEPPVEDCSAGIWPDLALASVCPTISDVMRVDPDTGAPLPPADARALPLAIPVSESGSFLVEPLPTTWPRTLRVVAWNMEYSRHLDEQIDTLVGDPELARADVYLLSEVDRCSARNGVRRAARMLAERVSGAYVYGIEFVELSIGRTIGGDTGQAIVSRRPLRGPELLCHSRISDWFASSAEPRLGQRVSLSAEVPVGDGWARVHAIHFESDDTFGEGRVVQVKETLDRAQALACERATVIAGDFNTWYPRAPERVVMSRAGFVDALEQLGDTGGTHSSGRRLDYVYVRGLTVERGAVLRSVETSDHSPAWVDLALP